MKSIVNIIAALACSFATFQTQADVSYQLVTIGDAGNANDITGFGAVNYGYRIGKYEVTIEQYTAFLNAVARDDPYGLYNGSMGGIPNVAGISRSGVSGSYSYNVLNNNGSSANRPVTSVSWFNAARFANWMANNQPTGAEGSTTTENGAYDLSNFSNGLAVPKNIINPNTGKVPSYYIPLENEWYKAAYYNGVGGYTLYATQSNTAPGNDINAPDSSNQVNYLSETTGYCVTQSPNFDTTQNYLTAVGTFTNSASHYGTFDQTGNVWEWNDMDGGSSASRGVRGAAYTSTPPYMQSTYRMGYAAKSYNPNGGFRLAALNAAPVPPSEFAIKATSVGSPNNLTLYVNVQPDQSVYNQPGSFFVVARLQNGTSSGVWYYPASVGWQQWDPNTPLPPYITTIVQATNNFTLLQNMDVSSYPGATIYVGYGSSIASMISAGTYNSVYRVPSPQ